MKEQQTEEVAAHEEAEHSLRLMKFAVDHASDSLFWIRSDAVFAYVNDSTCRRLGYTREEMLTMTVFDVDPAFPRNTWDAHWQEIKNRTSFTIMTTHRTKTGETFPVEVSVNHVEYEGAEYNFAFARDLSERKKAQDALHKANEELELSAQRRLVEETLRRSELKYRQLFSEMLGGFALHELICDSSGKPVDYVTLEINRAFETSLGVKSEQVIGKRVSEFLSKEELDHWLGIFAPVALTGESTRYEMNSPSNQKVFEGAAFCPEKGKFAVTFFDVTLRRRAEDALLRKTVELEKEVAERQMTQENLQEKAALLEEEIEKRQQAQEELERLNESLEQRVRERTAELEEKNAELARLNRVFVGRELKMVELKARIKELEK